MKIPRRKNILAFTLLEIMVAIALLAMIVVAIYASWNSIMKGSRVALDVAAEAQRKRITMRALHDSLLCSSMFIAGGSNYAFIADSEGEFSSLSFVARLPKSFPRGGKFGDFSVRRLEFKVENGAGGSRDLVLRQKPLIMDYDKDEAQSPLVLARDVTKFQVEYVDPKTGDWGTEWDFTNQLPKEVRITLGLGRLDQFSTQSQEEMVNLVALPAVEVRPEWQAGQPGAGAGLGKPGSQLNGTPSPGLNPNQPGAAPGQLPGQMPGQNPGQAPGQMQPGFGNQQLRR